MTNYLVRGAALALVFAAVPAAAQSFTGSSLETAVERVTIADINLATQQGERVLARRIDAAVGRLCGYPVLNSQSELDAIAACRSEARAAFDAQASAARARAVTIASR